MKVLFVSSGRRGQASPIVINQAQSLRNEGVIMDHFVIPGRGWKNYGKALPLLRKQLKKGQYDLIHAHYSWCGYLASIAGAKPLVVSLMGNDILDYRFYPLMARFFATVFHWKAVIVKSQEMKSRLGLSRAIVVPNGVNMNKFVHLNRNECKSRLGWDMVKTHVLFPANPDEIRKNFPLAKAACEAIGNIEIHGMVGVPNEETPIWYNAADAAILPSFYEGSPNAVKEALSCGCPIVTTDMGDCKERIEANADSPQVTGSYVAKTYTKEEMIDLLRKAIAFNGKTTGRKRLLNDGISDKQIAQRLIQIYTA